MLSRILGCDYYNPNKCCKCLVGDSLDYKPAGLRTLVCCCTRGDLSSLVNKLEVHLRLKLVDLQALDMLEVDRQADCLKFLENVKKVVNKCRKL
jgi:hypothetical protein